MEIHVKRPSNSGIAPPVPQRRPWAPPPGFRIGEKGRVQELHAIDNTVDVILDSGIYLKRVPVWSKEWVIYQEDTEKDYNAGERDLPPVDSRVFIFMPTGTYDDCFVFGSLFSTPDNAGPFLDKDEEKKRERIKERKTPSDWHTTDDNDTGSHKAVSPDKKTSVNIDYGSKDEPLDPPELHAQLFHDEENTGITLDVVSGKTIDMTAFKEDVVTHHEKEKIITADIFDKETQLSYEKGKVIKTDVFDKETQYSYEKGKTVKVEVLDKETQYTHEKGQSITLVEKLDRYYTNEKNVANLIKEDKEEAVVGDVTNTIGGNEKRFITGSRVTRIDGNEELKVEGDLDFHVTGNIRINGKRIDLN